METMLPATRNLPALPSSNGSNGRQPGGQFGLGNHFGRGNPNAGRVAHLRRAMLNAISAEDITAITSKLVEQAKTGDLNAIREVLNRTVGRPVPIDDETQPDQELTIEQRRESLLRIIKRLRADSTLEAMLSDGAGN